MCLNSSHSFIIVAVCYGNIVIITTLFLHCHPHPLRWLKVNILEVNVGILSYCNNIINLVNVLLKNTFFWFTYQHVSLFFLMHFSNRLNDTETEKCVSSNTSTSTKNCFKKMESKKRKFIGMDIHLFPKLGLSFSYLVTLLCDVLIRILNLWIWVCP